MFIIYNQDGSVKETNFTDFIQKGNNRAKPNNIYVRVNGWNAADYGAYAVFKLPNDQATVIIGELVENYEETIYTDENGNPVERAFLGYGYLITLTQDVTCFAGIVKCTIKVTDGEEENPEILYTYPVDLTVNDTHIAPEDLTLANLSQYNNLKRYLDGQISLLAPVKIDYEEVLTNEKIEEIIKVKVVDISDGYYYVIGWSIYPSNPIKYYISFVSFGDATKPNVLFYTLETGKSFEDASQSPYGYFQTDLSTLGKTTLFRHNISMIINNTHIRFYIVSTHSLEYTKDDFNWDNSDQTSLGIVNVYKTSSALLTFNLNAGVGLDLIMYNYVSNALTQRTYSIRDATSFSDIVDEL